MSEQILNSVHVHSHKICQTFKITLTSHLIRQANALISSIRGDQLICDAKWWPGTRTDDTLRVIICHQIHEEPVKPNIYDWCPSTTCNIHQLIKPPLAWSPVADMTSVGSPNWNRSGSTTCDWLYPFMLHVTGFLGLPLLSTSIVWVMTLIFAELTSHFHTQPQNAMSQLKVNYTTGKIFTRL